MYKPFKTIEDQVTLLESRGVECGRGTDATLLREGYYSVINGYKDPFLDAGATIAAGDDRYIPGTRFEDILHLFDFESLYASSHRKKRRITSGKLDSVYSRVKNFRNICAHDERLYCARPFGDNNSFAQLATDLELLLTKQRHREFLQRVESLMLGLERDLPGHAGQIFSAMGVVSIDRHQKYMDSIRDN